MTAAHARSRSFLVVAALAAALAAAATGASLGSSPATAASGEQTIVKTAAQAGQFGTLLALAKRAGLVGELSGSGPLTLFAPTDAAFKAVPKATLDSLAKNRTALRRVLLYHVVKGNVPASRIVTLKSAKTLAGPTIAIRLAGTNVFLNGSTKVVKADIGATNGTIHVINKVLLPPAK
jgi:uncharacterized surface protein with fasciclin (FAS1) repeats